MTTSVKVYDAEMRELHFNFHVDFTLNSEDIFNVMSSVSDLPVAARASIDKEIMGCLFQC